ncbi:MAG: alr [Acidobacteria bacterium]|nr:alr [Acidobacteriota bacterium]
MSMEFDRYTSWVEVSRRALTSNVARFKSRLGPDVRLAAVVKSNAYGHGLVEASRVMLEAGADWLAVNSVEETALLRHAGVQAPILSLAYIPLACLEEAVGHDLRLTVSNRETVDRLGAIAGRMKRPARVHIKVETGTNRQGVRGEELLALAQAAARHPYLMLEGLSTHYANIEDVTEHQFAELTAAALLFPNTFFNLARVGIGLYGLWPSKETRISALQAGIALNDLEPALTWKTRVAQIKTVPAGATIGYGCTDLATQDTRLAVLPVGYYEGYDRKLSSVGYALIRGRRAPVRGRVCMNMIMVDVTSIPAAKLEDEAVLLGRQGEDLISAETLAGRIGTINYEVVARINPLLPRIVV